MLVLGRVFHIYSIFIRRIHSDREGIHRKFVWIHVYLPTNLADLNGTFWDFCRMIQATSWTVGRIGSSDIVTQQLRDRAIRPPGGAGNEKRVVGLKMFGTLGQRKTFNLNSEKTCSTPIWVVVSNIFYFPPYLGR